MRLRIGIPAVMAVALAAGACGQTSEPPAADAPAVTASQPADAAALQQAMDPGEAQEQLGGLVGTFDVKVRVWIDPAEPPIESMAVAVSTWVLESRFVQTMLTGYVLGEPWSGIGYAGFDNVSEKYVATYMDTGSTGMDWFTGTLSPDGSGATLTATIHDAVTLEPVQAEMRVRFDGDDHVTELWQPDAAGTMVKVLELQYTRQAQ